MSAPGHSEWSASATTKNWACAGALTLEQQVAHLDKESEAAAWGTCCHEVAELCLRNGQDAIEFIERTFKAKEHEIECDEEMAECAQVYVDYVRGRGAIAVAHYPPAIKPKVESVIQIEQRFSLDKLKPPFDAGGTADAVIYFPADKLLEVIDLKGGRGVVVEVVDNKQLRTYALGAMLANPGLDVERVRSTIVQPRAGHKDGHIRSETFHVADLAEWTTDLVAAMNISAQAKVAYGKITGDISREKWAEVYLTPGDHCGNAFCKAQGICPALEKKAMDAAGVWFDDCSVPQLSNTPADLSPEKLATVLDAADMIQNYLNACRALAHSLAETGVEIPNYQLVDKIGRRRWINKDDEAALLGELYLKADLTKDDDIWTTKLKSPAQMEKVLGKRSAVLKSLLEIPVTGTSLVRTDKTTRKATKPSVNKHFSVIE